MPDWLTFSHLRLFSWACWWSPVLVEEEWHGLWSSSLVQDQAPMSQTVADPSHQLSTIHRPSTSLALARPTLVQGTWVCRPLAHTTKLIWFFILIIRWPMVYDTNHITWHKQQVFSNTQGRPPKCKIWDISCNSQIYGVNNNMNNPFYRVRSIFKLNCVSFLPKQFH